MYLKIPRAVKFLGLLALAVFLSSCGGGGGGSSSTGTTGSIAPSGSGSVGILLTDNPASLDMFSGVMMSVTKVELFNADSGDKVTAYDGRPRGPFNLLKLRNESRPLTFSDNVPSGRYCKIRLTLDDMWLTFKDGSPDYHPKLPGNNKLDLNARDCFYVSSDKMIYVQLDMDMSKSIHIVKRGNRDDYNVRPVVFIDVVGHDFRGKLVRLEGGTIEDVNRAEGTVLVCDAIPMFQDASADLRDECVTVHVGRDASAFDNDTNDGNTTEGGDAIPLADVFAPERVGRGPVTVVGYFRTDVNSVYVARKGSKGSKGNKGSKGSKDKDDSDGGRGYLDFDALVVELGDFLSLDGEVISTSGGRMVNEALNAEAVASSEISGNGASLVNDGIVSDPNNAWVATEDVQTESARIRLNFDSAKAISRVVLYDVLGPGTQLEAGSIEFSDGSSIPITIPLPNDGTPVVFDFSAKQTDWVQVNLTQAILRFGLAEIEAYSTDGAADGFNMAVVPGQSYASTDPLPVVLQPAPVGGNGTKILSRTGQVLTSDDIDTGQHVTVDGVLSGPNPLFLNSALVIVDTDALNKDIAGGSINRVGDDSLLLEADSFVCEPGTGPGFYVVNFNPGTDIYEVTESSSSIEGEFVDSDELDIGQRVDISGECNNGELLADTIVILP